MKLVIIIATVLIIMSSAYGLHLKIQAPEISIEQTTTSIERPATIEAVHPIENHRTVGRITWGKVPYERSEYTSNNWKSVRDSVCSAPTTFYTGESNDGACEADHVLSVSEAHHRGAHSWSDKKKRAFYTDEANLVPSEPAVNRDKSNHTPAQVGTSADHAWDAPGNDCEYVRLWADAVVRHDLDITRAERSNAAGFLAECEG